jgi:hypothetical protein
VGGAPAEGGLGAGVGDALALSPEAPGGGGQGVEVEGGLGRRLGAQQAAGLQGHVGGGRGFIIAEIEDAGPVRLAQGGGEAVGEVVHMDAAEHLAWRRHPPGGPVADPVQGRTAGPVDAG